MVQKFFQKSNYYCQDNSDYVIDSESHSETVFSEKFFTYALYDNLAFDFPSSFKGAASINYGRLSLSSLNFKIVTIPVAVISSLKIWGTNRQQFGINSDNFKTFMSGKNRISIQLQMLYYIVVTWSTKWIEERLQVGYNNS